MNIKSILWVALLVLTLAGGAFAQTAPVKDDRGLEPLAGLRVTDDGIAVTVMNKGYTTKDSFKTEISGKDATGTASISILRIKADEGKMMPQPLEIVIPAKALGWERLIPFKVMNPFFEKRF